MGIQIKKALGGFGKTFIEDVFSSYTYTGNGATEQDIVNGLNISGKGGMVWIKSRSAATSNSLYDTVRGASKEIITNNSSGNNNAAGVSAFNSNGFHVGSYTNTNANAATFVSWSFTKAAKFFDVVTWTGNGSNRTISHSLGIVPGLIFVKRTDTTGDWQVYSNSLANTEYLLLDSTAAKATDATKWNSTTATSSVFSLGTHADVNANGGTYVAYLFAHDTGTDGLIQCGSFTTDGSGNATVTLGWEPQYVIYKNAQSTGGWNIFDSTRGWSMTAQEALLANSSSASSSSSTQGNPTATGFAVGGQSASNTYIYVAIRRGPMRQPTNGTQVYKAIARTGTGATASVTGVGFPPDTVISMQRNTAAQGSCFWDRLRGANILLQGSSSSTENTRTNALMSFDMDGITLGADTGGYINDTSTWVLQTLRRYPGVMDQVCYTGTGSAQNISHNLAAIPELIISKSRSVATADWYVGVQFTATNYVRLLMNLTNAGSTVTMSSSQPFSAQPTGTQFSIGSAANTNTNSAMYTAWLFATLAGISKVFNYTGNGTSQTIDCGFSAGARFICIKRTDSTGDWFVWDSVRGVVAGNDPHLSLNTTSTEVTSDDSIDPDNSGFIVNQVAATNLNVSSATYVGLALS